MTSRRPGGVAAKARVSALEAPEDRRGRAARHRRGPGPLRRRPDPSQEPDLGRQYLQNALRLGNLEPQYQIWAAWSMVQAGYPEEAEPIVGHLLDEVGRAGCPASWKGPSTCSAARSTRPADARRPEEGAGGVRRRSSTGRTPTAGGRSSGWPRSTSSSASPTDALKRIEELACPAAGGAGRRAPRRPDPPARRAKATEARKAPRRGPGRSSPRATSWSASTPPCSPRTSKPKEADQVLAEFLDQAPRQRRRRPDAGPGPRRPARRRRRRPASSWSTSPTGATTRPRWSSSPCST